MPDANMLLSQVEFRNKVVSVLLAHQESRADLNCPVWDCAHQRHRAAWVGARPLQRVNDKLSLSPSLDAGLPSSPLSEQPAGWAAPSPSLHARRSASVPLPTALANSASALTRSD